MKRQEPKWLTETKEGKYKKPIDRVIQDDTSLSYSILITVSLTILILAVSTIIIIRKRKR